MPFACDQTSNLVVSSLVVIIKQLTPIASVKKNVTLVNVYEWIHTVK